MLSLSHFNKNFYSFLILLRIKNKNCQFFRIKRIYTRKHFCFSFKHYFLIFIILIVIYFQLFIITSFFFPSNFQCFNIWQIETKLDSSIYKIALNFSSSFSIWQCNLSLSRFQTINFLSFAPLSRNLLLKISNALQILSKCNNLTCKYK